MIFVAAQVVLNIFGARMEQVEAEMEIGDLDGFFANENFLEEMSDNIKGLK